MKAILFAATLIALAIAHEHQHSSAHLGDSKIRLQQSATPSTGIANVSAGISGSVTGYRRGMYKITNYTVSPVCFGPDMQQNIADINTVSS
jgi:hypothetical protein